MKTHPATAGLAVSETGPRPYDAIRFVLSLPPSQGVIVELVNNGPYRNGIFRNEPNPRKPTGVICPYCGAEVLHYAYAEFGFCMFICRDIGFFMRLPADPFSREEWAGLVRQSAKTWVEVAAGEKGGHHGGEN